MALLLYPKDESGIVSSHLLVVREGASAKSNLYISTTHGPNCDILRFRPSVRGRTVNGICFLLSLGDGQDRY
jgi:hypothetical protein